jgi:WD40 repeat protein
MLSITLLRCTEANPEFAPRQHKVPRIANWIYRLAFKNTKFDNQNLTLKGRKSNVEEGRKDLLLPAIIGLHNASKQQANSDLVNSVVLSHDLKLLASASDDKTVRIWDTSTGSLQQTLKGHSSSVRSVAFLHNSKLLAPASKDKTFGIRDASTGSCYQIVAVDICVTNLSFDSIDSNLLINIDNIKVDRTRLASTSEYPQGGNSKRDRQGLGISESWVTWNADNLL